MWPVYVKRTSMAIGGVAAVVSAISVLLWNYRPDLDAIAWPTPEKASPAISDAVTVTWLGVATLLFDDGETQILIDGFFSRPTITDILLDRKVENDAARINYALNAFRMRRLAAIIPVHNHFDHAMDIGAIANRSSASILGSESTAQIARGAGVPEDQIDVAVENLEYQYGNFLVTLRKSTHAPIGWGGSVPLEGAIVEPLAMPQAISAFRADGAYSIIIAHPQGTTIIQGSAGFVDGALQDVQADVVMLGVAQLTLVGKRHAEDFWRNTVTMTGARSVFPLHFDDYTQPFGVIEPWPNFLGSLKTTTEWLEEFRDRWDNDTHLFMPEFGRPIAIYSQPIVES